MMHVPRKCPITLCPKVKEHLDKMECLGMITHVDEPMDWVSSITYVQKANGKLCLCLDPCDLNKAICCDHHKMPTVEEATHEFAHSCFFTNTSPGLQPITPSDNTGQCLTGRPWCSMPAKWQSHSFCQQGLTKTECQYTNIEREMLAAVFGAERFHTYIYGQSFTIKSDHKLLESISRKNLADTPAWLQCMMLCLQGYNFTVHYCPGKEMVMLDMLS